MKKIKPNYPIMSILIVFLFLIATGIASWIISISTTFKPTYEPAGEVISALDLTPPTYDGAIHLPKIIDESLVNTDKYNIKYQMPNSQMYLTITFNNGDPEIGPVNAGKYKLKYENKVNSSSFVEIEFEIKKATPELVPEGYPTLGSVIYGQLPEMTKSNASVLATHPGHVNSTANSSVTVQGTYSFTDENETRFTKYNGTASTSIVYTQLTFTPNDTTNYNSVVVDNIPFTMEAVAKIEENYYGRIEDALVDANLAGSGTVIALIDKNPTIFENCSINSNVTLVIGYDDTGFIGNRDGVNQFLADSTDINVDTYRKNNVTIAPGIILTLNGGALSLDGVLGAAGQKPSGGTTGNYAQITLDTNSKIVVKSGSIFNCYGYVKEKELNNNSKVEVLGGSIYMPFVVYDYRGGTNTVTVYKKANISPFNVFDMPNIQSELYLNSSSVSGATGSSVIYGLVDLYANDSHNKDEIPIMSSNSNEQGLLNITSGYIKCKFYPTKLGLTTGESDTTSIEIRGNGSTKAISLTISVMITVTVSLESVYFPVNWKYNVGFYDCTYNINNTFKLLTGSNIYIDNTAIVNITNGNEVIIYSSFYDVSFADYAYPVKDGAKFIVNGKLNIENNAGIAGFIQTENTGAELNIGSTAITSLKSTEGNSGQTSASDAMQLGMGINAGEFSTAFIASENAKGLTVSSGSNHSAFSSGLYKSLNGRWYSETCIIYYDANGGQLTGEYDFEPLNGTYITPYTINKINTSNPYREHYNFVGWYADAQCTIPVYTLNKTTGLFESHDYQIYCNTYVFAKWDPINYEINYKYQYIGCEEKGSISNTLNEFNILTDTALITPVHSEQFVFGGWFADESLTVPIGNFIGIEYVSKVDEETNSITIYGKWYPKGTETYTITYVTINNNDQQFKWDSKEVISINVNEYVHQDNCAKFNNDTSYDKYFKGWYIDSEGTTLFDKSTHLISDITLYGIWEDKIMVSFEWSSDSGFGTLPSIQYYIPKNQTFTFPSVEGFEYSLVESTKITLYSPKWVNGSNMYDCGVTSPQVTTAVTYIFKKVQTKQFTKFTIGNKNSSVALATNSGYSIISDVNTLQEVTSFTTSDDGVGLFVQVGSNVTCTFTYNNRNYNGYKITKDGTEIAYNDSAGKSSTISNVTLSSYNVTASSGDRSGVCIFEESLIVMADGTVKQVTDVQIGDLVRTWSFEEGQFVSRPVIFIEALKAQFVIELKVYFDDGTSVRLAGSQSYFDMDKLEFFSIDSDNAHEYIGTNIMTYDNGQVSKKKIIDFEVKFVIEDTYEIITGYDYSFIYDNVISMEPFLLYRLPFKISENLKYDDELMKQDIEKYGLYTYDEWAQYGSEKLFDLLNVKYMKVSISKGNFTMEYLLHIMDRYLHLFDEDNVSKE